MFLPEFVCLSVRVCVCVCVCGRKDLSEILREGREWQQLQVIQFWGDTEKNPGFWITLKFSLTLLSMGHKGNRCQTEYGDATWRTT